MNRRKTPMLYTLGFLFFLILAFAVFFTGVRVGADKVEAKYEKMKSTGQYSETSSSYRQSDLVTFYHNVFSPYREFKRTWNEKVDRLASGSVKDASGTIKSLRALADDAYAQVTQASLFADSPLLEQSQLNVLKSLRLFSEAANKASGSGAAQAAKTLRNGKFAAGAMNFGLLAQSNYYASMLKWGSQANTSIPAETGDLKTITLSEWKKMPLLLKNAAIADILLGGGIFANYDPQDMTAKVDNLINSGVAASLNLQNIQGATSLLISTEALGERDFSKWRHQYYGNETLPALPFFYD